MTKVTRTPTPEVEQLVLPSGDDDIEQDETVEENLSIDDLDGETEIWENGPTVDNVKEWKEKFGDIYVTSVTANLNVAWRTINRYEFKQVVKRIEQITANSDLSPAEIEMINEELICQIAILFPKFTEKDFSTVMAGMPSIISQQVLACSGFNSVDLVQL